MSNKFFDYVRDNAGDWQDKIGLWATCAFAITGLTLMGGLATEMVTRAIKADAQGKRFENLTPDQKFELLQTGVVKIKGAPIDAGRPVLMCNRWLDTPVEGNLPIYGPKAPIFQDKQLIRAELKSGNCTLVVWQQFWVGNNKRKTYNLG